jgi:hypothetical protein
MDVLDISSCDFLSHCKHPSSLHRAEKQFSELLDGPFSYLSHPLIFWQVLETGDTLGEVTESVEYYTEGGTIIAGNLFGR